ncbi:hypothetical protein TNCV_3140231 [Trichonephila clavipes]|nr:hypothetical protein TNCV_3140231 [Trichonephila clavipes]
MLPVWLINTTNEKRLVQGHETPLRVKRDIEEVSSELDNGDGGKAVGTVARFTAGNSSAVSRSQGKRNSITLLSVVSIFKESDDIMYLVISKVEQFRFHNLFAG